MPDPRAPGSVIANRYRLDQRIGRGGMGEVWSAERVDDGERVAVKLIRSDATLDPDAKRRLFREARAAQAVKHPNVVGVREVIEIDGEPPMLVMDLLSGETLRARIAREAPLDLAVTAALALPIACALEAAHAVGVVHRDLKPDNVFLAERGAGEIDVKVLDFGIAKVLSSSPIGATTAALTRTGAMLGTPHYMAPEQILAEDEIDQRADVWALGVMLFEMLTGVRPTSDKKMGGILKSILMGRIPPIRDSRPDLPDDIADLVDRMLAPEPADRPSAMREAIVVLEAHAGSVARSQAPLRIEPAGDATRSEPRGLWRTPTSAMMRANDVPPDDAPRAPSVRPDAAQTAAAAITKQRSVPVAMALTALVAAAATAIGVVRWQGSKAAPVAASPSTAMAHASASEQARIEYTRARELIRGQSTRHAMAALERAVELDPSLGAAHLRLAMFGTRGTPAEARRHFERALSLRSTLSDRDRALLDAFVPCIHAEVVANDACIAKLAEASQSYPDDAEILKWLFEMEGNAGRMDDAVTHGARVVALDPGYAAVELGAVYAYLGRADDAKAAWARALEVAPGAVTCLTERSELTAAEGRCDDLEADAKRVLAMAPDTAYGYFMLANAMAAKGLASEGVRETTRQGLNRLPERERRAKEAESEAHASVFVGDFESARAAARRFADAVADESEQASHAAPATLALDIEIEAGRPLEAAAIADAFLRRRDAWITDTRSDDEAMAKDPTPVMLAAQRRAHAITDAAYDTAIAAYVNRWSVKAGPFFQRYLWIHGFAAPASTREEAMAAMRALPGFSPLPPFRPSTLAGEAIGKTMLLAGHVDEALPELRRAAAHCYPLSFPFEQTRAHAFLGRALEAKGDEKGACASYAVVVQRWGKAKPRSVTADHARQRMTALRCAR